MARMRGADLFEGPGGPANAVYITHGAAGRYCGRADIGSTGRQRVQASQDCCDCKTAQSTSLTRLCVSSITQDRNVRPDLAFCAIGGDAVDGEKGIRRNDCAPPAYYVTIVVMVRGLTRPVESVVLPARRPPNNGDDTCRYLSGQLAMCDIRPPHTETFIQAKKSSAPENVLVNEPPASAPRSGL